LIVLIDRKFNEEELLFETFSEKMHIERDIRNSFWGVKTPLKEKPAGGRGF